MVHLQLKIYQMEKFLKSHTMQEWLEQERFIILIAQAWRDVLNLRINLMM